MKKNLELRFPRSRYLTDICLRCCLTVSLACFFYVSLHAQRTGNTVTLSVNQMPVTEILKEIEKQVACKFMYHDSDLSSLANKTLNLRQVALTVALDSCFKGTSVGYELVGDQVILKRIRQNQQPQVRRISGTVTDSQGAPLPGVGIIIEGTTIGTTTDSDGKYVLETSGIKDLTLLYSFVGMKQHREVVGERSEISVVMEEEVTEMEEVVVTGIFTRKKESFTGSSEIYKAEELKRVGNQNLLQSLKILDPSFALRENNIAGSNPNVLANIEIRGKTSVVNLSQEYDTDPNQPLFILDGFESTLETISDLNMDRVKSITILKDASATAIYGSKAANGVVVVETLLPEAGKLKVSYSGNFSVEYADLSDYNLMNSFEKLQFEKLAGMYGNIDEDNNIIDMTQFEVYNSRYMEAAKGVNTDWLSIPLQLGFTHKHNLYIDGGDDAMRYGVGVSYGNIRGVMKDSKRETLNGNIRLIYQKNSLKFANYLNIDYLKTTQESVPFSKFAATNPYYRKYDSEGSVSMILEEYEYGMDTYKEYNPFYDMLQNNMNETSKLSVSNSLEIEWYINPDLRVRGRANLTKTVGNTDVFRSPYLSEFDEKDVLQKGSYTFNEDKGLSYDMDASLIYGKIFKEAHIVNLVAGAQMTENNSVVNGYVAEGFPDDIHIDPSFANSFSESISKPSYSKSVKRSTSMYFNMGYSYKNRYMFDFSYRIDGSSLFGLSHKFDNTWSLGLAWNIAQEQFMDQFDWLDLFKLRFSVGNPGNQNFDAYIAMKTYRYNNEQSNLFGLSSIISSLGNSDLKWQKTLDRNFGLDIILWQNRFKFTLEYYNKLTDPLLVYITVPTSTGASSLPTNMGRQKTEGVTLSSSLYLLRRGDFNWSINANLRHQKSQYQDLGNSLALLNEQNRGLNTDRYYDGGTPTSLWTVRSAGIDPATGYEVFIKKDGSYTFVYDYDDEVKVGDTEPTVEGIVGTSVFWKGFSCSMNFRYRTGGQIFMQTLYNKVENISSVSVHSNQDKRALYDRWQTEGQMAKYKSISLTSTTPISSRFVANESTFEAESITLGYETDADWLKKASISSMNVRLYLTDIFRFSTVKNERGLDYPFSRSVSLSLSLSF